MIFLSLTGFIAVFLSSADHWVYGQTEINNDGNATGYYHLNGRFFSFQYPSDWKVAINDEDEFEQDSALVNKDMESKIIAFAATTSLEKYGLGKNVTQSEIESNLYKIFPHLVEIQLSQIKRGTQPQLEKAIYDKYLIDGHKTGSVIYTSNYGNVEFKHLIIATIIGNKGFSLTYQAPSSIFDEDFIQKVINSVKFNPDSAQTLQFLGDNMSKSTSSTFNDSNTITKQSHNTTIKYFPDVRVYTNKPFGISMLHPSTWTASTNELNHYTQLISFYSPLQNIHDAFPARVTISAMRYIENISLPEYTNTILTTLNQSKHFDIINSSEMTLDGYQAHKVILSSKPMQNSSFTFSSMQIWANVGNKVFLISYDSEPYKFNAYLSDVQRMIQSIKFKVS